ncbi:MAG: Loki-CTERM sorting domain-containing protein [Promethearchaeota archaeon]
MTITVEEKSIPGYSFVILISIMGTLSLVLLQRKKMKSS